MRKMQPADQYLYRGIVTFNYPGDPNARLEWQRHERTWSEIVGPYTTASSVRFSMTLRSRRAQAGTEVTMTLQRAPLTWETLIPPTWVNVDGQPVTSSPSIR